MDLDKRLASELRVKAEQVAEARKLLAEGCTVPFILRFRKERVGGLEERKLYRIQDHLRILDELAARRQVILNSIHAQGKLTEELRARIEAAGGKVELEELYAPFGPRKQTPATAAREKGLEPLAQLFLEQQEAEGTLEERAAAYLSAEKGVKETQQALDGARTLVAERIAADSARLERLRELVAKEGTLVCKAKKGGNPARTKYREFEEPLSAWPAHRLLPLLRGIAEKKITLQIQAPRAKALELLTGEVIRKPDGIFKEQLAQALAESLDRLILPQLTRECWNELMERTELAAFEQISRGFRALLLQPPLGPEAVLALYSDAKKDHALAVLDPAGKLLHQEPLEWGTEPPQQEALGRKLAEILKERNVHALAVPQNSETRALQLLVRRLLAQPGLERVVLVRVDDCGLGAFANSREAKKEFPALAEAARAAISIGRRAQDPLAELVKVNPRFLAPGASQLDFDQKFLRKRLDEVISSCVNLAGVNLNTAEPGLLQYVSGLDTGLAQALVSARQKQGGFKSREELRAVPGITPQVFSQCAGFLRIPLAANPLDETQVHPEQYELVGRMAQSIQAPVADLLGNPELLGKITLAAFKSESLSEQSLEELLRLLRQGGRDPRGRYVSPRFEPTLTDLTTLAEGQTLPGIVTSHSAFGVFVDLGIEQEGLIHITELPRRTLGDPARHLPVGKLVKVKVMSIDRERRRIGLSMRALENAEKPPRRGGRPAAASGAHAAQGQAEAPAAPGASPAATAGAPAAAGTTERPRRERGDTRKGERRGDRTGANREAEKYPKVSPSGKQLPDFSKFFMRSKKERKKKEVEKRQEGASRHEVAEILRSQEQRSTPTLADLLKDAGVEPGAEQ